MENRLEMTCGHAAFDARFSLKGTDAYYAPDRTFDTEHIRLDLKIDIAREALIGRCRTTLRAITGGSRTMTFDAVNFRLGRVLWNGRKAVTAYKDGKLTVTAPAPVKEGDVVTVDIDYRVARPKLGLYFIKPNRFYPKNPTQVWTQGEDEYARYWFPCFDAPHERTSTEVVATVPRGFVAVSNGKLARATQGRSFATYHWRQDIPHAPYLVTLTVGRFSQIKDTWRKIPVTYYCEQGREADALRAFSKTPRMLEFFSSKIGVAYPYPKYAQIAVSDFIYGGMENTSATTQTDTALLDERVHLDYTSDELVAHELAHQWFGDYLTCKDWSHAWLNESFATYFDALFKRFDKGEEEFLYQIRSNAETYLSEDKDRYRRSIVTRFYRRPSDLFDRHLYEKGSVVLYMLHRELGEELFWKSIKTYVSRHRGQVVETADLLNAIEAATGRNMRRFFDQWVFGAGHPEFRVRSWWDPKKRTVNVRVVQSHATGPDIGLFRVATHLAFVTRRGEKRMPIEITKKSHLFTFPLDGEPELVLFDPDHTLLKRVDFPKSEAMLIRQLQTDKNPLGRIDAAHQLARTGSPTALQALRKALLRDDFWAVRAEVAHAIGSLKSEAASQILVHGLDVIEPPKIRRALYAALRQFKSQAAAKEVEKRFASEASYFAEAEGLRTLGALQHPRADVILKEALKKESWNDVIRMAALEGLAMTGSREWIPLFIQYTRPGPFQRLRMGAVRCLISIGAGVPEVQDRLLELTRDSFLLVQIAAVRGLHDIGDERAIPVLKKLAASESDGRLKRLSEEAVEKISKGFE